MKAKGCENPSFDLVSVDDIPILPDDREFIIKVSKKDYSDKVYIVHRSIRKVGGAEMELVVINSLDIGSLLNLRLELIDGKYFIVNDTVNKFSESDRIVVVNEKVGKDIIKALLGLVAKDADDVIDAEKIKLPTKYWQLNQIAERSAALIFSVCGVILTFSASFWFVFK